MNEQPARDGGMMTGRERWRQGRRRALSALGPQHRIALLYTLLGIGWIRCSDLLVEALIRDADTLALAQSLKGTAYVLVTGALLYVLIRRSVVRLQNANTALRRGYDDSMRALIKIMDLRHHETTDHTLRVTRMTVALGRLAGLDEQALEHLERGAMLHDVGKIGIPDPILTKPGPLTPEEWAIMRTHPQIGHALMNAVDFLRPSLAIPYSHHERWDGSGYPQGLRGEQIPLAARLFAVVDVWDALSSRRVYKDAWDEQQVLEYLRRESGRHFDPRAVALFIEHYAELRSLG